MCVRSALCVDSGGYAAVLALGAEDEVDDARVGPAGPCSSGHLTSNALLGSVLSWPACLADHPGLGAGLHPGIPKKGVWTI